MIEVKHENLKSVFEAFRRKHPFGQYLLIVVCGDDVRSVPPDDQPVRQRLAKIRGTYKPKQLAPVLKLDTNWLDKAFAYQKRLTF